MGCADDRVEATKLALLATDRDTEQAAALINEMIDEARKLVERHWPDIEALARRLLIKGRVNFLETEPGRQKTSTPGDNEGVREPQNAAPTTGGSEGSPSALAHPSQEYLEPPQEQTSASAASRASVTA